MRQPGPPLSRVRIRLEPPPRWGDTRALRPVGVGGYQDEDKPLGERPLRSRILGAVLRIDRRRVCTWSAVGPLEEARLLVALDRNGVWYRAT